MITIIRKKLRSKQYQGVVWVFSAAIIIGLAMPSIFRWGTSGGVVLSVNGHELSGTQLRRKIIEQDGLVNMLRQQYGTYADVFLKAMGLVGDMQQRALDELIQDELVNQHVAKLGLQVHPSYIEQNIGSVVSPLVLNGARKVDESALAAYLKQLHMSANEFDADAEAALARRVFGELMEAAVQTPQFEVKDAYIQGHLKKKYAYITLSLADFEKAQAAKPVTEEAAREFFDRKNREEKKYWKPERRDANVWVFDAKNYEIKLTDEQLQNYYDKHKAAAYLDQPTQVQVRSILLKIAKDEDAPQVRQKLAAIKEEIMKDPASFADVAKRVSEDKETAAQGGLVPFFKKGEKKGDFEKKAFTLAQDGDISDIFRTERGYELLQRVGKKAATYKPLASVKNEIVTKLTLRKFKERFGIDARALIEEGSKNAPEIEAFAQRKKAKKETITGALADSSGRNQAIFRLKNEGEYTTFTTDDEATLVQVTKITKRSLPSFESVQATVEADVRKERAMKELTKKLAALEKDVKAGKELEDLDSSKVVVTEWVKPGETKELEKLKLSASDLASMSRVGAATTSIEGGKGHLVVLKELEKFDNQKFEEKKAAVMRELHEERSKVLSQGFVASLYRTAKIERNEVKADIQEDYPL